mmetsp:Transcript_42601/g.51138  ORF Transcript_42601/g.51138 Transcript_42601/m.51138 type:complete len:195 (+) Transcript_42601:64-648(+)
MSSSSLSIIKIASSTKAILRLFVILLLIERSPLPCRALKGTNFGFSNNETDSESANRQLQFLHKLTKPLKQKYKSLPETGKFVTGAVTGYASTSYMTRAAVGTLKAVGVGFIASEVLAYSGFLEQNDEKAFDSEKGKASQIVKDIRRCASNTVDKCRVEFRNALSQSNFQKQFERDPLTSLGFASGAAVALVML